MPVINKKSEGNLGVAQAAKASVISTSNLHEIPENAPAVKRS
jgi:hypothetical protein